MKYKKILLLFLLGLFSIALFSQTRIIMKNEGGIYTIPCKVNGLDLKFIFDTGASNVTLSLTEALFMIKNGYLSRKDIYGSSYYQLANGELTENTEILLREIDIANLKLYNVKATIVHELGAPLLLGISAISKLGKISLNGNELVILTNSDSDINDNQKGKTISEKENKNIKNEYDRGNTALSLGDYQQSINSFRYVVENTNDSDLASSSYGNLGIAYEKIGNYLESIMMFDQACKTDNFRCPVSAFNKGLVFNKKGKFSKAIEEYKECILLEPKGMVTKIISGYNNMNYISHFNIGNIYAKKYGDCNNAIKHYLASIKPYNEESLGKAYWRMDAINNIAYCYYELGDYLKCIEYYKIILKANKYDKNALVSICYAYDHLGDKRNAKKYCKMASDLGDERAKYYLNNN